MRLVAFHYADRLAILGGLVFHLDGGEQLDALADTVPFHIKILISLLRRTVGTHTQLLVGHVLVSIHYLELLRGRLEGSTGVEDICVALHLWGVKQVGHAVSLTQHFLVPLPCLCSLVSVDLDLAIGLLRVLAPSHACWFLFLG